MADLTGVSWDKFPLRAAPSDQVSKNFKFYELTASETAERLLIDNRFTRVAEVRAAVHLCRNVLQPIRDKFGRFTPNSVFRGQELERALKKKRSNWTSTSQHTLGQACDIEIPGMPTLELADWVAKNLEFDQIICECYDPRKGPNSGWVHVSIVPPGMGENRGKLTSYVLDPRSGKYVYVAGLQTSGTASA